MTDEYEWYVICLLNLSPYVICGDSLSSIRGYDPIYEVMNTPWNFTIMEDIVKKIIPDPETNIIATHQEEFYDASEGFIDIISKIIDHPLSTKILLDLKDAWLSRHKEMVIISLSPKSRGSFYYRVIHVTISYVAYPFYVSEMVRWILGYSYGEIGYNVRCKVYDAYKSF